MKTIAYFDCASGVSGDMFIGALLDAGLSFEALRAELDKLTLEGCCLSSTAVTKSHICATQFDVDDGGHAPLRHLSDLNAIVDAAALADGIADKAKRVFQRIAEAEAAVHGVALESVHFHEVGAVDTVVDVVGALVGLDLLGVSEVYASALNLGSGSVTFSHGTFSVPAPATARLLEGVPAYGGELKGELVTPTGAALISTLATAFGAMPEMVVRATGYGAGKREHAGTPNVLRVTLGEAVEAAQASADKVSIIETNIDDMNPEHYEYVMERLLGAGALDVFMTPVIMKKNRPGVLLSVMCGLADEARLCDLVLSETTTLGVRVRQERRAVLLREIKTERTTLGDVHVKVAISPDGSRRQMLEHDDCRRIAQEHGLPLHEVTARLMRELA